MNLERHIEAHRNLFTHLVKGDGDSAQKHREFYDEYLAVMDLSAEYYLQTVDTVFVRHALPKGAMTHRGAPVDLAGIQRVALLTVEGENDDISGLGQTEAAHALCVNIPADRKSHWMQPGVGHYGVFNGSRFRAEIAPRIADFVLSNNGEEGRARRRAAQNAGSAASGPNGSKPASANAASALADAAEASVVNE
jgi:poly(3-hydroxybutyrate) depolymerase